MRLTHLINQKPYEHIVQKSRRSLVTLGPAFLALVALLALPLILRWLLERLFPGFWSGAVAIPIGILAASLYYLCCVLFFYSYFVDFYLDLLVLTNDRLIRINQHGLFSRTIFEVDLYQIQDTTSEVNGVAASLFGYGNITIQTTSTAPKLVAEHVHNPHLLRKIIMDLAAEDRQHHVK